MDTSGWKMNDWLTISEAGIEYADITIPYIVGRGKYAPGFLGNS